jgi:hypothetical protein
MFGLDFLVMRGDDRIVVRIESGHDFVERTPEPHGMAQ